MLISLWLLADLRPCLQANNFNRGLISQPSCWSTLKTHLRPYHQANNFTCNKISARWGYKKIRWFVFATLSIRSLGRNLKGLKWLIWNSGGEVSWQSCQTIIGWLTRLGLSKGLLVSYLQYVQQLCRR